MNTDIAMNFWDAPCRPNILWRILNKLFPEPKPNSKTEVATLSRNDAENNSTSHFWGLCASIAQTLTFSTRVSVG